MLDYFWRLFDTTGFPPRWSCGSGWTTVHGWLHILSDGAIWAAYFTIPGILVYFAARKKDLPFRMVFLLFGAFILACGTTHLMDAVIFWWPAYRLSGLIKLTTALVSWATVFALIPNVPRVLAMRSPEALERDVKARTAELHAANESLQGEIEERRRAESRFHFLAEASEALVRLIDLESTLQIVARLAVPRFASWCVIDVMKEAEHPARSVCVHTDASQRAELTNWAQTLAPTDDDAKSHLSSAPNNANSEIRFAADSMLSVPLIIRSRLIGRVLFGAAADHPTFQQADLEMAEDLGRRIAVAVDNARLHAELRDADRRKDEFLAMLGHELRNPLAPVRNALTILNSFGDDEKTRQELLPIMSRQVEHMVHMVDDLLDVSRIMRGKIELRMERVSLEDVVYRAVETVRPICDERQQTLQVRMPDAPVPLYGDLVRLCQVLVNLLQNASKYSPPKTTIDVEAELEPGGVAVTVRDQGMGIEPALLPKIFDLFTQSARTIERAQGGLGIGLTVVRSIVEMHGGTVEVHSNGPEHGAEFTVHLSLDKLSELPAKSPAARPSGTVPRLRVLIVEDNVGSAQTLATLLERFWQHETLVEHDGLKAVEAAESFRPDVIFLDIGLPGLSGYDIARRLREKPQFASTILVALTGYGQSEDRRRSREAGFDEHLIKPAAAGALEPLFLRTRSGLAS
ncbi:MAG: histidine kinase [Pirellula sp.]|nr:histidine kinase [Pirellula sp.]